MKTDTADSHWNQEWANIETGSAWLTPEPDVQAWAATLAPGARILDLGAGVGRHALWQTRLTDAVNSNVRLARIGIWCSLCGCTRRSRRTT